MKICAVTMVYRDYWALSKWYAHYARHLGAASLYVVSHGHDPKVSELCPGASVITIPRDSLEDFDLKRGKMLNHLQDGLAEAYDWVIRTDTDELICFDPATHASFEDVLSDINGDVAFALGFEVFTDPDVAVFTGHYSKAWAVRNKVHLMRHGVVTDSAGEFSLRDGVYLAHLKYVSKEALDGANAVRSEVANSGGNGLPGKAWAEADADAQKVLRRVAGLKLVGWSIAEQTALDALKTPVITDGIVRAKSARFDVKALLPEWFKYT